MSRLSVEKFVSQFRKTSLGIPCVSEKFWYRKMLGIREGAGITIFCQNCFVSQYRNISFVERNSSMFQKVSGIEKFYAYGGNITISIENLLSNRTENFRREPFCAVFQKISGSRKVYG